MNRQPTKEQKQLQRIFDYTQQAGTSLKSISKCIKKDIMEDKLIIKKINDIRWEIQEQETNNEKQATLNRIEVNAWKIKNKWESIVNKLRNGLPFNEVQLHSSEEEKQDCM